MGSKCRRLSTIKVNTMSSLQQKFKVDYQIDFSDRWYNNDETRLEQLFSPTCYNNIERVLTSDEHITLIDLNESNYWFIANYQKDYSSPSPHKHRSFLNDLTFLLKDLIYEELLNEFSGPFNCFLEDITILAIEGYLEDE